MLASGYELTFNTEVANNFTSAANGHDAGLLRWRNDVSHVRISPGARRGFEWGIEMPWVTQDGGHLDHPIENFHDAFGFPNNGRPAAKLNKIDYYVSDQNKVYVDFQDEKDGLGDVRVSGGYQLLRAPERSLAVRALVKLPTGDVDQAHRIGCHRFATWLDYTDRELLARFHLSMTAAIGVMVLGDGDLLPQKQNRFAGYGHFGLSYPLSDAVDAERPARLSQPVDRYIGRSTRRCGVAGLVRRELASDADVSGPISRWPKI